PTDDRHRRAHRRTNRVGGSRRWCFHSLSSTGKTVSTHEPIGIPEDTQVASSLFGLSRRSTKDPHCLPTTSIERRRDDVCALAHGSLLIHSSKEGTKRVS